MRLKYRKDVKRCPRCNQRALPSQPKCHQCGLIYSRVESATNAAAKKQFFKKDKAILMVKKTPKDVNRIKLILLSAFLGPFGAHNFYIGRYYKAIYMAIFGGFSLFYILFQQHINILLIAVQNFLFIPIAFIMIFWLLDFINIVFERYKIPVAIEAVDTQALKTKTVKNKNEKSSKVTSNKKNNKKTKDDKTKAHKSENTIDNISVINTVKESNPTNDVAESNTEKSQAIKANKKSNKQTSKVIK